MGWLYQERNSTASHEYKMLEPKGIEPTMAAARRQRDESVLLGEIFRGGTLLSARGDMYYSLMFQATRSV
jgi:hypothetical protein